MFLVIVCRISIHVCYLTMVVKATAKVIVILLLTVAITIIFASTDYNAIRDTLHSTGFLWGGSASRTPVDACHMLDSVTINHASQPTKCESCDNSYGACFFVEIFGIYLNSAKLRTGH